MKIHQNLKDLRMLSGMTQEQAAQRAGVTRQAISGYETGRTQPDLDMLVRLAEIYRADVSDILYGTNRRQKKMRVARRAAQVSLVLALVLLFAASGLLCALNNFAVAPSGSPATEEVRRVVELRFAMLDVCAALRGLSQLAAIVGCAASAVGVFAYSLPSGRVMSCAAGFGAACFVCTLPFSVLDGVYSRADYLLAALGSMWPAPLLLIAVLLRELWHSRKKHA